MRRFQINVAVWAGFILLSSVSVTSSVPGLSVLSLLFHSFDPFWNVAIIVTIRRRCSIYQFGCLEFLFRLGQATTVFFPKHIAFVS